MIVAVPQGMHGASISMKGGRSAAMKSRSTRPSVRCACVENKVIVRFTGQVRDRETGLEYFNARYFSGAQGRFTSADNPKFSEIAAPQSWNLCAYVENNPLSRIDPLGHNWFYVNGTWMRGVPVR